MKFRRAAQQQDDSEYPLARSLPPRPLGHRVFGEVELPDNAPVRVSIYVIDPRTSE